MLSAIREKAKATFFFGFSAAVQGYKLGLEGGS